MLHYYIIKYSIFFVGIIAYWNSQGCCEGCRDDILQGGLFHSFYSSSILFARYNYFA